MLQVAGVLLIASTILMVGHTIKYWSGSNWRSTLAGKAALSQSVACSILAVLATLSMYVGTDHPAGHAMHLAGYTLTLGLSLRTYLILDKYQRINKGHVSESLEDSNVS